MQAALRRSHPALDARLLVRDDATRDASETWMETYALPGSSQGVDADLEHAIATAAASWSNLLDGERHVEAFLSAD